MDRVNWYHGQTVLESELDGAFDDVESMERAVIKDVGLTQGFFGVPPDATVFGGITRGLVVARHAADDYVDISAGECRDQLGRRIVLDSAATVKITNTGTTTEGAIALATSNGAVITGSCPAGQRIIASLFIVYDTNLTDPATDASGTTVYFDVDESFHFDIQIGVAFAHPPAAPPSVAVLADNKVLLADLLLTNNAGNMEVVASGVCTTNQNWDAFAGNYVTLAGRRSDHIALDQTSDFPQYDASNISLRKGTDREAIHELVKSLQVQAATPCGANLIGVANISGALDDTTPQGVFSITAGHLRDALANITNLGMNALVYGGGNTIKAQAYDGLTHDPTNLQATNKLEVHKTSIGGSVVATHEIDRRGRRFFPCELKDDFVYNNVDLATGFIPEYQSSGAGTAIAIGGIGGILRVTSPVGAGNNHSAITGYHWNISASPWAAFQARIRAHSNPDTQVAIYLTDSANDRAGFVIDMDVAPKTLKGWISNAAGGSVYSASLVAPVLDTWYTVKLAILTASSVEVQLGEAAPITVSLAAGAFTGTTFNLVMTAESKVAGGGAAAVLDVDCIYVTDLNRRSS